MCVREPSPLTLQPALGWSGQGTKIRIKGTHSFEALLAPLQQPGEPGGEARPGRARPTGGHPWAGQYREGRGGILDLGLEPPQPTEPGRLDKKENCQRLTRQQVKTKDSIW